MQSVVFTNPGNLRLAKLPLPIPCEDEVRLRVCLAGICSTDVHIFQGHLPIRPPRVLGHELVGVVEALGSGIPESWLGQSCGVRPARFCGQCAACRQGLPQLCANFTCLGNTQDGAFAEYTIVRTDQLVPLDGLSVEAAVWLEPLACVLHALETSGATESQNVLVAGAGVLGKLMIMTLHAISQTLIAVVDPNANKILQAIELGAQTGWAVPRSGPAPKISEQIQSWAPDGLQVVIDTSGSPIMIERAIAWVGPGATILLFGVSDPATRLSIAPTDIFNKELKIGAASGMTPASFRYAEQLLRLGRIEPQRLVTAVVDLTDIPSILANRALMKTGKVLVRPGGETL